MTTRRWLFGLLGLLALAALPLLAHWARQSPAGRCALDGVPIISLNDVPLRGFNSVLKRAIDIAISSVALAILSPFFGIIALLIKRTSPGPVFYKQERMGLDGKAFNVYKFR